MLSNHPNCLGGNGPSASSDLIGDVDGPASATDNAVARFDGTTGKLIQNSVVTIADTTGAIAGAQSLTAPAATNLTLAGGTAGSDSVVVSNTLAASSAIIGAFKVGNGTAATNVAIGGGNINAGGTGTFAGAVTVGGAIYSSSFLDATGGVGTPVSGHGQFSGSGAYGAVIAGYGSAYDFALFNRSGVDVLHVATNTTTAAFSGAATFGGAVTIGGSANLSIQSGAGLYLDGGSNTYIVENVADSVQVKAGGLTALTTTSALTTVNGNLTVSGTGTSTFSGAGTFGGRLAINAASVGYAGVYLGGILPNLSGDTNGVGYFQGGTFPASYAVGAHSFYSAPASTASAYTLTNMSGFYAAAPTKGAGSTITNLYGVYVEALTQGTNNYAFRSAGAGVVSIGDAAASSSAVTGALQVAGGIGVGAASYFGGAVTVSAAGSRLGANAEMYNVAGEAYLQVYSDDATISRWRIATNGTALEIQDNYNTRVPLSFAGNTQVATFAGAVTAQGDVSVTRTGGAREVRIATTTSGAAAFYAQGYSSATTITGTAGGELVLYNQDSTANTFGAVTNLDAAGNTTSRIRFINESDANNTGSIAFATRPSGGSLTDALTLASTGAATFAGAVTIGNTVNTVSPTSPNRTVTMVVNGVTLYLAAKTTND